MPPNHSGDKCPYFLLQTIHICWEVEGTEHFESLSLQKNKKRLISFQTGQLYRSLQAQAVYSEHDLINSWL